MQTHATIATAGMDYKSTGRVDLSRAHSKRRAYLQTWCLLAGVLNFHFALAQTASPPVDFDATATCTFLFLGGPPQPNQPASILQADIACIGSYPVQMRIAPDLSPFLSAFTGMHGLEAACQVLPQLYTVSMLLVKLST